MELHHLHYASLGEETTNDVLLVCSYCHVHYDNLRYMKKSVETFKRRYKTNHKGKECPQDVLLKFITTKLIPNFKK
jgi:hypothetical protein